MPKHTETEWFIQIGQHHDWYCRHMLDNSDLWTEEVIHRQHVITRLLRHGDRSELLWNELQLQQAVTP